MKSGLWKNFTVLSIFHNTLPVSQFFTANHDVWEVNSCYKLSHRPLLYQHLLKAYIWFNKLSQPMKSCIYQIFSFWRFSSTIIVYRTDSILTFVLYILTSTSVLSMVRSFNIIVLFYSYFTRHKVMKNDMLFRWTQWLEMKLKS